MRVERRLTLSLLLAFAVLLGGVAPTLAAEGPRSAGRTDSATTAALERLEQSLVEQIRWTWIVARHLGARLPEPPLSTDGLSDGPDPIGAVGDSTSSDDREDDASPPGSPEPGSSTQSINWGNPPRSNN